MKIAIIGATGVLGREIVAALAEADDAQEFGTPQLLATERSTSEVFPWLGEDELTVEIYSPEAIAGADAAIVATPSDAARPIVARLRELGIPALDASRANRAVEPIYFARGPLGKVGPALAAAPVLALPSAEALQLAYVISALEPLAPRAVRTHVLKAASGAGQPGVTELAEGTGRLLNGQEPEAPTMPHRLAFNVVPQAGPFENGESESERDLAAELPRMLGKSLLVAPTISWAPWFYGHFQTVTVHFDKRVTVEEVRTSLTAERQIKLLDDPTQAIYPMPSLATGDDTIHVGRVRMDPLDPRAIQLVTAMDNARASAAHAVTALAAAIRARRAH